MNIAILNLGDIEEVQYSIDCLKDIKTEMIASKIDLFVDKSLYSKIEENNPFLNNIIYLDLKHVNIFNIFQKNRNLVYYTKNRYNISIDTQYTLKSAYFNYLLSGKTAGFIKNDFKGRMKSILYDETIKIENEIDKKTLTKKLLSRPFGF